MVKKKLFRTDFVAPTRPSDPEALFRDLKGRAPEIRHLWSHQADILRRYHETHLESADVAFELPTGTGKTLIGLLIGEFRRQRFDERVVYLTPTRMLAHQVGEHANRYGIPAHGLVGPQEQYPAAAYHDYELNRAIAITTYSGLFNTNPRLREAHTIILDDAHAGDTFISRLWSVEISRTRNRPVWQAITDLFRPCLPPAFADRLRMEDVPPQYRSLVELVPGAYFRERMSALRDIFNAHLRQPQPAWYAWQLAEAHLVACNLFIAWDSVLLRPVIPPTHTHQPFSGARHRVYMSATLGDGGELERVTGVRNIARIPAPAGWDQQGSGRRLFLLPLLSLSADEVDGFTIDAIGRADRALVLAPNNYVLDEIVATVTRGGFAVLQADDIEESLEPFTSASATVLALANRYDGLDLPDEACRLLLLNGLPGGTNLQEQFLLYRLAATSLLRDRLVTRLTQAVGRCTRSDTDYAAVLVLEQRMVDFVLKSDTRAILHPEIQAELEFGIENSRDQTFDGLRDLVAAFLAQTEEWADADAAIKRLRQGKRRAKDPIAERLRDAASLEVEYAHALWAGQFERALEKARQVCDTLSGDAVKAYRAWWYYLAADAALTAHQATGDRAILDVARDLFSRASVVAPAISWLAELTRLELEGRRVGGLDPAAAVAYENVVAELTTLGFAGPKFERMAGECLKQLESSDHDTFVLGLESLGRYLGFDAERPDTQAAPDCVWSLKGYRHIAFEAKVEEKPDAPISPASARQAVAHAQWVRANRNASPEIPVVAVLITPRKTVAKETVALAGDLRCCAPALIRKLAEETVACLRTARAEAGGADDSLLLEKVETLYGRAGLDPVRVQRRLEEGRVADLPPA